MVIHMNKQDYNSYTKGELIEYIISLKEIGRQKTELIKFIEKEDINTQGVVECWYCHRKYGKGYACGTCGREGKQIEFNEVI